MTNKTYFKQVGGGHYKKHVIQPSIVGQPGPNNI